MANNFKVWDEGNNQQVDVQDFYDPNGQRGLGFQPGYSASASFVNSGLRQANLFSTAFMQMVEDSGIDTSSVNFKSSVAQLQAILKEFVNSIRAPYRHIFRFSSDNSLDIMFYIDTYQANKYTSGDFSHPSYLFSDFKAVEGLLRNNYYAIYDAGLTGLFHASPLYCIGRDANLSYGQVVGICVETNNDGNANAIFWVYYNSDSTMLRSDIQIHPENAPGHFGVNYFIEEDVITL